MYINEGDIGEGLIRKAQRIEHGSEKIQRRSGGAVRGRERERERERVGGSGGVEDMSKLYNSHTCSVVWRRAIREIKGIPSLLLVLIRMKFTDISHWSKSW